MSTRNSVGERLATLSKRPLDILVIGGGIQGAGVAREAALRGLSVALFEKGDFASGTSGKTSSLIHGGLRYLEQGDIRLVHEAVCERSILSQIAPHLVTPLPFLFPIYEGGPRKKITLQIGITLYDLLAGKKSFGRPTFLPSQSVRQLEPNLSSHRLQGAMRFFDGQMDDGRLCLAVLLTAQDYGAALFNNTKVIGLIQDQGKVCGVTVEAAGQHYTIHGTIVINATGAWSDQVCQMEDPLISATPVKPMRPTKGIHIVLPQLTHQHAVVLSSSTSRRIFFVIPWKGYSLIGTTDTDDPCDPNHVAPTSEEIAFLIQETDPFFPSVTQASVLGSFAALRPLMSEETQNPWDRSRQEQIQWTPGGMLVIRGGKYTLFRKIALRVIEAVLKKHRSLSVVQRLDPEPLLHGGGLPAREDGMKLEAASGLSSPETLPYLTGAYGTDYKAILKIAESDSALLRSLTPLGYPLAAEVIHAVRNEYALHLSDFMMRRTRLAHGPYRADLSLIQTITRIMGTELGWSCDTLQKEKETYLAEIGLDEGPIVSSILSSSEI